MYAVQNDMAGRTLLCMTWEWCGVAVEMKRMAASDEKS